MVLDRETSDYARKDRGESVVRNMHGSYHWLEIHWELYRSSRSNFCPFL